MVSLSRYFTMCITYQPALVFTTTQRDDSYQKKIITSYVNAVVPNSIPQSVLIFDFTYEI